MFQDPSSVVSVSRTDAGGSATPFSRSGNARGPSLTGPSLSGSQHMFQSHRPSQFQQQQQQQQQQNQQERTSFSHPPAPGSTTDGAQDSVGCCSCCPDPREPDCQRCTGCCGPMPSPDEPKNLPPTCCDNTFIVLIVMMVLSLAGFVILCVLPGYSDIVSGAVSFPKAQNSVNATLGFCQKSEWFTPPFVPVQCVRDQKKGSECTVVPAVGVFVAKALTGCAEDMFTYSYITVQMSFYRNYVLTLYLILFVMFLFGVIWSIRYNDNAWAVSVLVFYGKMQPPVPSAGCCDGGCCEANPALPPEQQGGCFSCCCGPPYPAAPGASQFGGVKPQQQQQQQQKDGTPLTATFPILFHGTPQYIYFMTVWRSLGIMAIVTSFFVLYPFLTVIDTWTTYSDGSLRNYFNAFRTKFLAGAFVGIIALAAPVLWKYVLRPLLWSFCVMPWYCYRTIGDPRVTARPEGYIIPIDLREKENKRYTEWLPAHQGKSAYRSTLLRRFDAEDRLDKPYAMSLAVALGAQFYSSIGMSEKEKEHNPLVSPAESALDLTGRSTRTTFTVPQITVTSPSRPATMDGPNYTPLQLGGSSDIVATMLNQPDPSSLWNQLSCCQRCDAFFIDNCDCCVTFQRQQLKTLVATMGSAVPPSEGGGEMVRASLGSQDSTSTGGFLPGAPLSPRNAPVDRPLSPGSEKKRHRSRSRDTSKEKRSKEKRRHSSKSREKEPSGEGEDGGEKQRHHHKHSRSKSHSKSKKKRDKSEKSTESHNPLGGTTATLNATNATLSATNQSAASNTFNATGGTVLGFSETFTKPQVAVSVDGSDNTPSSPGKEKKKKKEKRDKDKSSKKKRKNSKRQSTASTTREEEKETENTEGGRSVSPCNATETDKEDNHDFALAEEL